MKTLLKRFNKKNNKELRQELAHAHLTIALLSLGVIALLSLGSTQPITFDPTLSAICVILLSLVSIISLCMAVTLYKKK